MNNTDNQYIELLQDILTNGIDKKDRTGVGTRSVFGRELRFNLQEGFPILTTKKIHWKSVVYELLWMLAGDTNIKYLNDNKVTIWDEWADKNGSIGPGYGKQWRNWTNKTIIKHEYGGSTAYKEFSFDVDQFKVLINNLQNNPDSRRLLISAWAVHQLEFMKLPPCHYAMEFYTQEMTIKERFNCVQTNHELREDNKVQLNLMFDDLSVPKRKLSCKVIQRSADCFLGVPFNIAQYALLTHIVANMVNMVPHELIWSGGDVHIYNNHFEQVGEQVSREPFDLPTLKIHKNITLDMIDEKSLTLEDFELINYKYHPSIKAEVAV